MSNKTMLSSKYLLTIAVSGLLIAGQVSANRAEVVEYDPSIRTQPPKVMEADVGMMGYVNDKFNRIERSSLENADRLDRLERDLAKIKQLEAKVEALEKQVAALKAAPVVTPNEANAATKPTMTAAELEQAQQAYKKAFDQLMAGKYPEAGKLFKEFVEKFPHSDQLGNAYYWYGETQFVARKYEAALSAYTASVEAGGPKQADALLKQGECYIELKKLKEAKQAFEEVKKRFPDSAAAKQADKFLVSLKK
jgi:tol-pal system protein YbgF